MANSSIDNSKLSIEQKTISSASSSCANSPASNKNSSTTSKSSSSSSSSSSASSTSSNKTSYSNNSLNQTSFITSPPTLPQLKPYSGSKLTVNESTKQYRAPVLSPQFSNLNETNDKVETNIQLKKNIKHVRQLSSAGLTKSTSLLLVSGKALFVFNTF